MAATFHQALTTKDWALMRTVMSPDVTWSLPGDNMISGPADGVEAVIARADLIAGYGLAFTLEHVLLSRTNMALALHNTANRDGLVLDEHLATVCTLAEGKIVEIKTYLSDLDMMNAFFALPPAQG